jgi:AhpD family alkylhydroperoxidase
MGAAEQAFKQFLSAAFAPGALDAVQKELTIIALSVAVQCEPCLKAHLAKAQTMGLTRAEVEEAAWLGVAFGGCKAMMFWAGSRPSLWN